MKRILLLLILFSNFIVANTYAGHFDEYLDRKEVQRKIKDEILKQDIDFDVGLADFNLIDGIKLSSKYKYRVEASYIPKSFSRIDKWSANVNINVGDVLKQYLDVPFSFSVARESNFYFIRQFKTKVEALGASPYGPQKLPLNADLALKNLKTGDFVNMPATLSVAMSASTSTSDTVPITVAGVAEVYYVVSGEYTVQVFKLDDDHVRLKLITTASRSAGGTTSLQASFEFFRINALNRKLESWFDRDIVQTGLNYSPGSQFIIDYVFNLKDPEAQVAYNNILGSSFKFKDAVVADNLLNASSLKDKVISSYEKADEVYDADRNLPAKDRRVQRIFKGFNDYIARTKHLKLGLFVTGMTKDKAYTENKVTFIDKNEHNLEFSYPTSSKYFDGYLGKSPFQLEDQIFQNNFGLIPRFMSEENRLRNPDLGVTFERKDKSFTVNEQKKVKHFLMTQIPEDFLKEIDLSQWENGIKKQDSRIYFQLILKSQGFDYLKNLTDKELRKKIVIFIQEKNQTHLIDDDQVDDPKVTKLKEFFFVSRYIKKEKLLSLADKIAVILKNESNNTEDMLKNLVALNNKGIFDQLGIGFLISLLPKEKLQDLVYLKLEMIGKDLVSINKEIGSLNYKVLYKELNEIQARLTNRSSDLRVSDGDLEMADIEIEKIKTTPDLGVE